MRQIREMAASRPASAELKGRALNASKNSFKTHKAGSKPKPSATPLFTKVHTEQTKPRMALLTREQAKSLLLEKRDAYLAGKLSCRPQVVKSLIKRLVASMVALLEDQPQGSATLCCQAEPSVASLGDCSAQPVLDF